MNNHVIKLAQFIQQNGLTGTNHGLMHGDTGNSIFFYHLARETGNPDYEKIADDLLDKVFANLSSSGPVDFENGLAGIGWGIEYLVQNNFAKGDTDKILEEVDNKVFRVLNEESLSSFELTTGLTGYLFYLINRLKNKTTPISMAQRINRELLILTINKIDELATVQFPLIVKEMHFDLMWRFPVMLAGLSETFKLNIYNEKIICMIKQWMPNLEAFIPSLQINRIYLATALMQICYHIPDQRLEKQIQILLFATDFEVLKTEINQTEINIRYGWPGFICLIHQALEKIPSDYPNYSHLKTTYQYIIKKYIDTIINMQLSDLKPNAKQSGISEGIAGVGLFSLFIPGIFSNSN